MIKQNHPQCMPIIRRVGCFVRSCGALAELKTGRRLKPKEINKLWIFGKSSNLIDRNNDVKESAPLATEALRVLGDNGRFIEIATFKDGVMNYYSWVTPQMKEKKKWFIQKIKTNGQIGTHFRVVNHEGELIFDPYEPECTVQGVFHSVVYIYLEE